MKDFISHPFPIHFRRHRTFAPNKTTASYFKQFLSSSRRDVVCWEMWMLYYREVYSHHDLAPNAWTIRRRPPAIQQHLGRRSCAHSCNASLTLIISDVYICVSSPPPLSFSPIHCALAQAARDRLKAYASRRTKALSYQACAALRGHGMLSPHW